MKKIYFIRHAKSRWDQEGISDFQRGLSQRGKDNIKLMGDRLKKHNILPDLILSSPAKRARKTACKLAKIIGYKKTEIKYEMSLYECSSAHFLSVINSIDKKHNEVFITAHNPAITEICESLSNSIIGNIPTCGIVCIEFNVYGFDEIQSGYGKIDFFDYPKRHTFK